MTLTLLQGHTIKSELWKNGTKCDEETCFKGVLPFFDDFCRHLNNLCLFIIYFVIFFHNLLP